MYNYPETLSTECVQLPGMYTVRNFHILPVHNTPDLYLSLYQLVPTTVHRLFSKVHLLFDQLYSSSTGLTITTTIKYIRKV